MAAIVISVIIPVYNAEKYIEKCICSLVSQSFKDCEFIFVNDGSSDKSKLIIETYQKQDSRIRLINHQNQGVSVARNTGIAVAKGKYIGFVDADDYVEKDWFEKLYEIAITNNVDIVIANYFSSQGEHVIISKSVFQNNEVLKSDFIKKQIIPHLIENDNLNAIWSKLYKRDLILDNKILFPVGVPLGEDGWFNFYCFNQSSTVFFSDYAGYHYVGVPGSATRNFMDNRYFKRIEESYLQDYSSFSNEYIDVENIEMLKVQKFVKNIISLLHEYYHENNQLESIKRKELVKYVFNSSITQQILQNYFKKLFIGKSKYEQIMLLAIRYKMYFLLRQLIRYSNFRNKIK